MQAVHRQRPDIDPARLANVRRLMIDAVADSLVSGYEPLIPTLRLADPGDRHVLAAAITGRADVIVTWNLRHFPADVLAAYDLRAETPDEFIMGLERLAPSILARAAAEDRARYRNPPLSPDDYLERLRAGRLARTAAFLAGAHAPPG
jgi:hypothetical protein